MSSADHDLGGPCETRNTPGGLVALGRQLAGGRHRRGAHVVVAVAEIALVTKAGGISP